MKLAIRTVSCLLLLTLLTGSTSIAQDQKATFSSADEAQRQSVVAQIGRAEEVSPAQFTVLLAAANDPSEKVRRSAALALASHGVGNAKAVEALMQMLKAPQPAVRAAAAYALGRAASKETAVAQALAKLVTDQDASVRRASMNALQKMQVDPHLVRPVLIAALQSGDPATVAAALHELASLGEQIIDKLNEALEHEEGRYWASLIIQEMGPTAKATVTPLRKVLKSELPEDRLQAILALAAIGEAAQPAAADLVEILKNDDFEGAQFAAAYALGRIGAKDVAEAPLLAGAKSEMPLLKLMSAWSLAKLYPNNAGYIDQAVDAIFVGITSDDPTLGRLSARALVESDLPFEKTAPLAVAAIEKSSPATIEHIVEALATQGKAVLPRVKRGLTIEKLRSPALRIIQKIGPDASELLGDVVPLLGSENETIRREALFAVASMGVSAKSAAKELAEAYSKETVRENRLAAIYAAGKIGPSAAAFIPHLKKLALHPSDEQARVAALWALSRIAANDDAILDEAIPAMIKALNEADRPVIRIELIGALGDLGARAKLAVPALKAHQTDSDPRVSEAAKTALKKIAE